MISVILNVYKRPHTLEQQIECVLNQSVSVRPENIHVWYNNAGVDQPDPSIEAIKTYRCGWNTKFFGRFLVPLLCTTEYVAIFDDDIFPPRHWFENCLSTMKTHEGILGGSGVLIKHLGRSYAKKVGWNGSKLEVPRKVDFVGHTWFFRQEWAKYMWYEAPYTWDNAEDMMFSYLAQKYGGIQTFVPPHPPDRREVWCTDVGPAQRAGRDRNASWKKADHVPIRIEVIKHCLNNGWKTIRKLN